MGRSRAKSGEKHREASCPGCGATLEFRRPGTLTKVCEFCNTAVRRTDFAAEDLGKLSERLLLASWFQIGTRGRYQGRSFEIRGQLQLDHGRGLWNEWAAEFDDGDWCWIAEAQGSLYVLWDEEPAGDMPLYDDLGVDAPVPGLPDGNWTVCERGEGKVVTAAGELPVEVKVGQTTRYADVCQGERGFGTVDWTRVRREPPELLLGEMVAVEMLDLDPGTQPEHRPDRVESRRVECPKCGDGLDLHDPEITQRVVCPACRTVLSNELGRVKALQQEVSKHRELLLELGREGTLEGRSYRLLGMLTRRVRYGGQTWTWDEYLLREKGRGYAFLVENQGHWALLHPINPGASSSVRGGRRYRGLHYKHFTSGNPKVVFVLGEFFWDVMVGDESRTHDYVSPPRMLSLEGTDRESLASEGAHVETADVFAAFREGGRAPARRRKGVGMCQPNPHRPLTRLWGVGGLALVAMLLLLVGFAVASDSEVLIDESYGPVPATESPDAVVITEPFTIEKGGDNLRIRLRVPGLDNGWVGVAGTLVEVDSGEVRTFVVDAGRWSGVEGGESWTEGSREDQTFLGSIPAGNYQMRFASLGSQKGVGQQYGVEVRRDVLRASWFFLALLALLVWPIIVSVQALIFEKRRWDESDHPWGESS